MVLARGRHSMYGDYFLITYIFKQIKINISHILIVPKVESWK